MTNNSTCYSSSLNVLEEKSGRQESGSNDNNNNGSDVKNQTENSPTDNTKKRKVDDSQIHNKSENLQLFPHYSYSKPFQGKAIFVVNKTFVNKRFEVREGAENELSYLQSVFVTKLGFEQINSGNDFDIEKDKLDSVLKTMTLGNPDCFVFAICTHGEQIEGTNGSVEQALVFKDGKYTSTTDIITICNNVPSLAGKPKIFLIQACRTPKNALPCEQRLYDPGHTFTVTNELKELSTAETIDDSKGPQHAGDSKGNKDQADSYLSTPTFTEFETGDSKRNKDQVDSYPSKPNFSEFQGNIRCPKDCLVVYAITPGKTAWRDTTSGSWMIYYLKEVIDQYEQSHSVPLLEVVTKIAFKMAERETDTANKPVSHGKKAVCVMQHRLTKDFIFPPRINDLMNTQDQTI